MLVPFTITTKSVSGAINAGSPAHGPIAAATCGTMPESFDISAKWGPPTQPARTYSSARAPDPSKSQIAGTRFWWASSSRRSRLSSPVVPTDPPMTVKSSAPTRTSRPSTRP